MKEINYIVTYICDKCKVEKEVSYLKTQRPKGNRKFVCSKFLELNKKDFDKLNSVESCELRIKEVKNV